MKALIPLVFLIVFLGILASANIYMSKRFAFFFEIDKTWILYMISSFISVYMIFGVMAFSNSASALGSFVYKSAAVFMGIFLYYLLTVLVLHIVQIFVQWPSQTFGLLSLGITMQIIIFAMWHAFDVKVTHVDVPISGLKSEIRAVHISDVHIGHFRGKDFLQLVVDKTNREQPDVVFITGDLFDGKINLDKESLSPLAQLSVPVFFVDGNHDKYTGEKAIKVLLRKLGVHVLENEVAHFHELQIIGLNHMHADNETRNMHASGSLTIKDVFAKLPMDKNMPTVLLHHSPDGIKYADMYGVDLYLAGHTHAGQLFPINYIAEMMFPYNRGLHQYGHTKIYVSEGVGTFGPPMRLGTKSEIISFRFLPDK